MNCRFRARRWANTLACAIVCLFGHVAWAQSTPPRPPSAPKAVLVRNPASEAGQPAYGLIDQFGRVQRLVEASPKTDLEPFVGQQVRVRQDTGKVLLASQLELPRVGTAVVATAFQNEPPAELPAPTAGANSVLRNPPPAPKPPVAEAVSPIVVDEQDSPFTDDPSSTSLPSPSYMTDDPQYFPPGDPPECTDGCAVGGRYGSPLGRCPNCSLLACNCGVGACGPSCVPGSRGTVYTRFEYLMWWLDGMETPPLVTTSPTGTAQADAGVLGETGTTVLFGGGEILDSSRNGMRITLGAWLNDPHDVALEGDVFWLGSDSDGFSATGTAGSPILARPFFNMVPINAQEVIAAPREDAQLVSYPNVLEGTVSVSTRSEFGGAGIRGRWALCCCDFGCASDCCDTCGPGYGNGQGVNRIDGLLGYRYLRLDERVLIREDLTSLRTAEPGDFDIYDQFDTSNEFNGADLGMVWQRESPRWSLEMLGRIAVGTTRQRANIQGATTISNGINSFTEPGGLLALRSNIGTYERDVFTMVPELGVTLGYKLSPRLQATVGYTLIYWGNVARPGELIDRDINPNLLPPIVEPVVGPERPEFTWVDSDVLVQGLNIGLAYRF